MLAALMSHPSADKLRPAEGGPLTAVAGTGFEPVTSGL